MIRAICLNNYSNLFYHPSFKQPRWQTPSTNDIILTHCKYSWKWNSECAVTPPDSILIKFDEYLIIYIFLAFWQPPQPQRQGDWMLVAQQHVFQSGWQPCTFSNLQKWFFDLSDILWEYTSRSCFSSFTKWVLEW